MKKSLRSAVNETCKSCSYDSSARGTWRQQITLCSVKSCPLWPHRPITSSGIPASVLEYYGADSPSFRSQQPGSRLRDGKCV